MSTTDHISDDLENDRSSVERESTVTLKADKVDSNSKPRSYAIYQRPPACIPGEEVVVGFIMPRPNVFGEAVIGFILPRSCELTIELLEASGRKKIATLAEGWYEAGKYEARTDGLTSGFYLWHFQVGDYCEGSNILVVP